MSLEYTVSTYCQILLRGFNCYFIFLYAAQEESLKEMTSQLARVDALTREGKTTTLHILTREAADEERRELDRELERLRAALKEKDKIISERDTIINDRDQES